MRLFRLLAIFIAVGLVAFSLAISGLGAFGNAIIFSLAAGGLLFWTVNLTSAKRAAQLAKVQNAAPSESAASGQ